MNVFLYGSQGELMVWPSFCGNHSQRASPLKAPWPIKATFYVEHPKEGATVVYIYINGQGHMTKSKKL